MFGFKAFAFAFALLAAAASFADDVFDVRISLNVPRVYSNTESQGYRKYQRQTITGKMVWKYGADGTIESVKFRDFVNITHRMSNGKNVEYSVTLEEDTLFPRFNLIGSNRTRVFKTPSVSFYVSAEPTYSIGAMNEDNSLYVLFSGTGTSNSKGVRSLRGTVSGTIGCGCSDYGHLSPTRMIGLGGATDIVDDVASVFGTWKA